MDTRTRKRRWVVDLSSQDDLDDPVDSESEDLMCGQFYDDAFVDKSSSDVEMFSEVSFFYYDLLCFFYMVSFFFHDLALIFYVYLYFLGFIISGFSYEEFQ